MIGMVGILMVGTISNLSSGNLNDKEKPKIRNPGKRYNPDGTAKNTVEDAAYQVDGVTQHGDQTDWKNFSSQKSKDFLKDMIEQAKREHNQ